MNMYIIKNIAIQYLKSKVLLKNAKHNLFRYRFNTTIANNDAEIFLLIDSYHRSAHKFANTNLLYNKIGQLTELDDVISSLSDSTIISNSKKFINSDEPIKNVGQIRQYLNETYCGTISAEFHHLENKVERDWFAYNYEAIVSKKYTNEEKINFAKLMQRSQAFDLFLSKKFPTVKRYSGEGAEASIIFYDQLFKLSPQYGVDKIVMCAGHRGRLNALVCLLGLHPVAIFNKMKGKSEYPPELNSKGDVLLHLTSTLDYKSHDGIVNISLLPNPSHLEAANPVAVGNARAKMQDLKCGFYENCEKSLDDAKSENDLFSKVLCLQVSGDAAFSGQGIVAETLLLANLNNYKVGGSIHLIINNQIGYTTETHDGRSSSNCSDVGKVINCPVLRVNGDFPESVAKASDLALNYRKKFSKDIIVDLVCFRKHGHNELDEPSFTQPLMYNNIRGRKSVPDAYQERLAIEAAESSDALKNDANDWSDFLNSQFQKLSDYKPTYDISKWCGLEQATNGITKWDTGVDMPLLKYVGAKSVAVPNDFTVHTGLLKSHVERRVQKMISGTELDWATAEALAFGSLLVQGFNIRLSGQDVGRGTFSQRHVKLTDQTTNETYVPLNHIMSDQKTFFEVANSPLSEEAVVAFEYGFSINNPNTLVIWEAQFGDFFNPAQTIIDIFIASGEDKWLQQSGLTLLLPHGLDGAGPEHSSCRIERFLQLCDSKETAVDGDNLNMQVAFPTTPAQYFHLLRRQMVRNFRKPLVVAGPKGLLRNPLCVSTLEEMASGSYFKNILTDLFSADATSVKKIIFLTGKHFYAVKNYCLQQGVKDVAIVRIEGLSPFPAKDLIEEISKYKNCTDYIWSQEEHRNQGAWSFMNTRFSNIIGKKLRYCGRSESSICAVGIEEIHLRESEDILKQIFK